jgi:hypothetical protein
VFTPEDRTRVRARLLELAHADERITGAALTGSAAKGTEHRWSDVDLFFGVSEQADFSAVLTDWTDAVYGDFGAIHHFDVPSGSAIYRVFLLPGCLQVDLAFVPEADFASRGPNFRTVFGKPAEREHPQPPAFDDLAGLGWLSVLHAHACIERGRLWQAEYWISSVRDQTAALACTRLGEPAAHAKGVHRLPPELTAPLEGALVRALELNELRRALRVAAYCLLSELRRAEPEVAARLQATLFELARS